MNAADPPVNEGKFIEFDYLKSNLFRVVHSTGAHGGPSPKGGIEMAFYADRNPIPQKSFHPILASGKPGEIKIGPENVAMRQGRPAIVRDVEVQIVMPLDAATELYEWLGSVLRQVGEATKEP